MPVYKMPDEKAEECSFKMLGSKYENSANQLYKEVIKYSHVNDKNEWYEKHDDTLSIAGSNIIDLISYSVKPGITDKPYSWNVFVEFLKLHKNIPHILLADRVKKELKEPKEVPLVAAAVAPPSPQPTPFATPMATPLGSPKPLRHPPVLFPMVPPPSPPGKCAKTNLQNVKYLKKIAKSVTPKQTGYGL